MHPAGGFMTSPDIGNKMAPGITWAADNGRYGNPDKYTDERFLSWLDSRPREGCLFAVAPDVVGDAAATLESARPMLPRIRELGYPAAFAGQDGATPDLPWDEFDCMFIGGTTEWKLSQPAGDLMHEARLRGKHVHVGRVNSYTRLRVVSVMGAHSADGTFLAFGPDKNLPRLLEWLARLEREPVLPLCPN